ncbi:MAG: PCP reductase family protein [Acidimicrobiia bacterium]
MHLQVPDGGSDDVQLVFGCPLCDHTISMMPNSGETQLVESLGVHLGAADGPPPPMAGLRSALSGARPDAVSTNSHPEPTWTEGATARLARHPTYVQPVIRKTNIDFANRHGLREITPEVMDACQAAHDPP